MAMLDHLLDEDAFDRFVTGAYVAGAEAMEGQDGDDEQRSRGLPRPDFRVIIASRI